MASIGMVTMTPITHTMTIRSIEKVSPPLPLGVQWLLPASIQVLKWNGEASAHYVWRTLHHFHDTAYAILIALSKTK